jgi:integrase
MKRYKEKGGKIYARITYTDAAGKQREVWRRAGSKTEAKEIARQLEDQLKTQGSEAFEHRGTLDQYLDKWLISQKQSVSERTLEDYIGYLRLYVRPILGRKRLSNIHPLDVQHVIDTMKQKGLSPRTVKHAHSILGRALNQAVKWRILVSNPARYVDLPKQVRKEMKFLTPKQARLFLRACEANRFGLIFELALISGMRPEEYLAVQWTDLDFQKCTVTIQRVIVWKRWKNGWYFSEPKTPKSRRTIPLPSYLMKKFQKHRKQQLEHRLKMGEEYQNEHNLVFTSEIGTPVSLRNLERRFYKPLLTTAGLPDIRLYDLRHSCATLLLAAGENPKVVSERLGHSTIVLTLDVYSHVLPTMQKEATKRLEGILRRR